MSEGKFKRDFHHPSPLFSKLILLSVETGIATGDILLPHLPLSSSLLTPFPPASAAVASGILFVVQARGQSFDLPATILEKLYANSLMRVLNNRVKTESGYSEPFSTVKPEITTLPMTYELGPSNSQQAFTGVGESVGGNRETQTVQKAEEV